ncbi:MAG TPA: CPBP family intramembrane glutamic endopeptidase [Rhizomicrobium sp.]|nr:CPBP family intramembrane glutamic endopeptidase [Rhizomicrobium sp.]
MADTAEPPRAGLRASYAFLGLGFALSWYPWVLHALGRPGNPGPNPLGLLLAALIASALVSGWRGSAQLLRSMVRVQAPAFAWGVALFLPAVTLALALFIAMAKGIAVTPQPPPWSDLLDRFIIMFLFVALGEEPAWRGFLLPRLQDRFTPVMATLILSVVWAVWHLPLMGTEFAWQIVPAFLVSLLGAAFVLSWLFNASGGSVLLPMAMHAILNTIGSGYIFHFIGANDLPLFWWIYASVWLGAGVLAVIATRGRLGLSDP